MKKFMLTFFGGNRTLRYDNLEKAEKEAQQKHRAAWGEWMSELIKAGHLEVGYPLKSDGKRIDANGSHDYHFPDTTEGGFIVIKAASLDQAAAIAGVIAYYQKRRVYPCASMRGDKVNRNYMNGQYRKDIYPGQEVAIILKKDQRTGKLTYGIVKDLLTSAAYHSRGIKVRLEDGQIGRVAETDVVDPDVE